MEWNGHSLVGKSFDEVHDVITDSRHDSQVELRVARSLTGGHALAGATPSGSYATDSLGRPVLGHHQFPSTSASRPYSSAVGVSRGGRGPSVTLSDPLGGTTHMLNPPPALHHSNRHPDATRIQVGFFRATCSIF